MQTKLSRYSDASKDSRSNAIPCECHNERAREDGTTLCGIDAFDRYKGRYMCRGHYELYRLRDRMVDLTNGRAVAFLASKGIVRPNGMSSKEWIEILIEFKNILARDLAQKKPSGLDWAHRIVERKNCGEMVECSVLKIAEEAIEARSLCRVSADG